jgi:hypothetical protein
MFKRLTEQRLYKSFGVKGLKQWTEKTREREREKWSLVVEEAKARPGLQRREDGCLIVMFVLQIM